MKGVFVCALLIVLVLVASTDSFSVKEGESRVKNTREICYHVNCVTHGYGCVGKYGTPCGGICYCMGSGYEYRCHYCDIFG